MTNPWDPKNNEKNDNEKERIEPERDAKFISNQKDAIVLFDCLFKASISNIKDNIRDGILDFEITLKDDNLLIGELQIPAIADFVQKCEVVILEIDNDLNFIFIFRLVKSIDSQVTFKDMQVRIEKLIPQSLQGEFFKNELKLRKELFLPSIYVYNTEKFQWFFNQKPINYYDPMYTIPSYHRPPTTREELFQFVDMFYQDPLENTNYVLFKIDANFSKRIAVVGKTILVFLTDSIHSNEDLTFTSNLLIFCSDEFSLQNELIFNLLCDLSQCFHLMVILAHGLDELYLGDQPSLSKLNLNELSSYKKELIDKKTKLSSSYFLINKRYWDDFNLEYSIISEETLENMGDDFIHAINTLSNHYKSVLRNGLTKFNQIYSENSNLLNEQISYIQAEQRNDQFISSPLFRSIEAEVVKRVKYWKPILDQREIEN